MKNYILTEHEIEVIQKFLMSGVKEKDFKMILHRSRKNYKKLKQDMELIQVVLRETK